MGKKPNANTTKLDFERWQNIFIMLNNVSIQVRPLTKFKHIDEWNLIKFYYSVLWEIYNEFKAYLFEDKDISNKLLKAGKDLMKLDMIFTDSELDQLPINLVNKYIFDLKNIHSKITLIKIEKFGYNEDNEDKKEDYYWE